MSEELYYIEENILEYGSFDGWGWSPSQVFYNTGRRNNDIYVKWIKKIYILSFKDIIEPISINKFMIMKN